MTQPLFTVRSLQTRLTACALTLAAASASAAPLDLSVGELISGSLGTCTATTAPAAGQTACDGTVAIDINTGPSANHPDWPTWGVGLAFDLMRMRGISDSFDTGAGRHTVTQTIDFAVGQTGGGSAGPCLPDAHGDCTGAFTYGLSFSRAVTLVVAGLSYTQTLVQDGTLQVGWVTDVLTLQPADLRFALQDGTQVQLHFDGVVRPDPSSTPQFALDLQVQIVAIPEPATAALWVLGLGAVGAVARRRRG